MLSPEAVIAIVAVASIGLGYCLHALRVRGWKRGTLLTVKTDSGGHRRPFTVADYDERSAKVAANLRDSVLGAIGGLRRDIDDMAELLGKVHVSLIDALGRATRDREETRLRQELSETGRQELRAELMGMRKGFLQMSETLQAAAGQIGTAIQHFEKRVEEIFK